MGVSSKCQDRGRRREGEAGVTGCVSSPKTLCPDAGRGGGEAGRVTVSPSSLCITLQNDAAICAVIFK